MLKIQKIGLSVRMLPKVKPKTLRLIQKNPATENNAAPKRYWPIIPATDAFSVTYWLIARHGGQANKKWVFPRLEGKRRGF